MAVAETSLMFENKLYTVKILIFSNRFTKSFTNNKYRSSAWIPLYHCITKSRMTCSSAILTYKRLDRCFKIQTENFFLSNQAFTEQRPELPPAHLSEVIRPIYGAILTSRMGRVGWRVKILDKFGGSGHRKLTGVQQCAIQLQIRSFDYMITYII